MPQSIAIDDLPTWIGREVGSSAWFALEQGRVDAFAHATEDHQWIHVDPIRAGSSPYGGTIAHGYLTLALVPHLVSQVVEFSGVSRRINYGLDRVRFPAPALVPCEVRATVTVRSADRQPDGSTTLGLEVVIGAKGSERPVCVAQTITVLQR